MKTHSSSLTQHALLHDYLLILPNKRELPVLITKLMPISAFFLGCLVHANCKSCHIHQIRYSCLVLVVCCKTNKYLQLKVAKRPQFLVGELWRFGQNVRGVYVATSTVIDLQ
ncbi:uncharacterized protein A4U43_C02F6480 [Asparagus officinalis]|uniref:Uncharacterized protein n=1 Tax=Asparagus officinalis TaxID=4686 RepID=A0A5P1FI94_ASPOF|nr:uncharacterized protein A4U43_C02F6480 [Asparagus officinalis]